MNLNFNISFLLILVSLFSSNSTLAQKNELRGFLTDSLSGEPLIGAHVFLNNTTIGTATDVNGEFILKGIPNGKQLIVFSYIGYKNQARAIEFPVEEENYLAIRLKPDPVQFQDIEVVGSNKAWRRNLRKFEQHFLGYTPNSREMELVNPEVLNFESYNGMLRTTSNAPLEILNKALGYKITYYLEESISDFDVFTAGFYARFEEMTPSSDNELKKWENRRTETYEGSFVHFVNSVSEGLVNENNFTVFGTRFSRVNLYHEKDPFSTEMKSTIDYYSDPEPEDKWVELFIPRDHQILKVLYTGEKVGTEIGRRMGFRSQTVNQMSWIEIPSESVTINKYTGSYSPSTRYILHGYWGWTHRIPEALPDNYTN